MHASGSPKQVPSPSALQDRQELERLFTLSLDLLCVAGFDGYFKLLNPAWEKTLGYTTEELLGRPYLDFVHEEDRGSTAAEARKLALGADTVSFENRYCCKDGSYKWLLWGATPATDRAQIYAVARDVTDRKRAERRLAAGYAVTRVLAEEATLDSAAPLILRAICKNLDWEMGALWRADDEHDVLRCIDLWRVPRVNFPQFEDVTRRFEFSAGVGLPGRVWSTAQPAWIPDVVADKNFPRAPIAAEAGLHGAFGFPIRSANRVITHKI